MPLSKKIANFLYFWDLRSGMLISASVIIGVYLMSLGANAILPNYERDKIVRNAQYMHVFTFLVTGIIASFMAFFAAQTKNIPFMIMGLIVVLGSWSFYVFLFVTTFMPEGWREVCISDRCPESLWMWTVKWRIPKQCEDAMRAFPVAEPPGIYSNVLPKSIVDDTTTMLTNSTKLNFMDAKLFSEPLYDSKLKRKKPKTEEKKKDPYIRKREDYKPQKLLMIFGMVLGGTWIAILTYHVFIAGVVLLDSFMENRSFDVMEEEVEEEEED